MTTQQATITVRKIESPVEQARVDQLYRNYQRTLLPLASCLRCQDELTAARDTYGKFQLLTRTLPTFVQIRDSDTGEHGVQQISGLVDHTSVCRGQRA